MKFKKFIAIATAAAFALTGTAYADTGENLATEGSDVSQVIEDISLMGDRIDTEDSSYYTGDMSVNYSLCDEAGIKSVAIVVNGETIAEKTYDASDAIETEDGEVINADSTVETEGEDAVSNTSEAVTSISDSLVISAEKIKELEEAKADEPAEDETAEPANVDAAPAEEPAEEATEEAAPAEEPAPADVVAEEAEEPAAEEKAVDSPADENLAAAEEPAAESTEEPATEEEAPAEEPAEEPQTEDATSTYDAEMVVTDVNGNTETKAFSFNVAPADTAEETAEAVNELKASGLGNVQVVDSKTYRVEVNLTCQVVTVYMKNESGGYDPIRVSICSTGRSGETTPTGTFTIGPYKSKCGRSKWALLSGGKSFAQYLVRFRHGICFHSVIYKTRGDNASMYRKEYNKLGGVASAGCVRMQAFDAKWIYDHCPDGTKVRVYRDSVASPLGVPMYNKLTSGGTYSWDPTDPDTGNPFRGGNGVPTGIYVAFNDGYPTILLDSDLANHKVNLSTNKYVYNGKVRKPSVTIYGLTKDTNFKVTYPAGRKNVGRYVVTVEGKGSFMGSNYAVFQIVPKSTKIKSLKKSGSKKFKVKYKKITKQISGYEIMYSKSSSFKSGNKTVKINSYKTTAKTIKTGAKGTYYVKVRVFKNVDGTTFYSSWSKKKKVKVK